MLHPSYNKEEMRKYRKPCAAGITPFLERHYGYRSFGISLPITSICNFNCNFCFYKDFHKGMPNFPLDLFQKLLNQLSNIREATGVDTVAFGITGGEPTCDMEHLAEIARMLKPYSRRAIYATALITSGQYGKSLEDIRRIDAMGFDMIQISLSEVHHQEQNMEDLLRICQNTHNTRLHATAVDEPGCPKIFELYKEIIPYIPQGRWVCPGIRNHDWKKLSYLPTDVPLIRESHPDGITVYPDGSIAATCIGSGNKHCCKLGTIDDIVEIAKSIQKSWVKVNFWLRPLGVDGEYKTRGRAFTPICPHLRNLDISACCKDGGEFDVFMNKNREIICLNRAEHDFLA